MCCFTQPIRHVSRTRIFARPVDPIRQLLVYAMTLEADAELAMVLPIPVPPSSPEDAVRFVDLSSAPRFFDDLESLFPKPENQAFAGVHAFAPAPAPRPLLAVHEVGDFVASFVPTPADFARLHPRFRFPPSVWDALPAYRDWGFCVFGLRVASAARATDFHPMAFEFPRRQFTHLFFPTVHVHDGVVRPTASFDHTLYCQGATDSPDLRLRWQASAEPARALRTEAVRWLDPDQPVRRTTMLGSHPNRDAYLEAYPTFS